MFTPQKRTVTKTVTEFRIPLGEGTVHARDLSDTMHVVGSFVRDLRKTDSITDDAYQVDADSESIVFVVEHPDEEVKWLGGVQPTTNLPSAMSRMESTLKFLLDNGPCAKSTFASLSNIPMPSLDILLRLNLVKHKDTNGFETYAITPAGKMLLTGDASWVDGEEDEPKRDGVWDDPDALMEKRQTAPDGWVDPEWGVKGRDWTWDEGDIPSPGEPKEVDLKITVDTVYDVLRYIDHGGDQGPASLHRIAAWAFGVHPDSKHWNQMNEFLRRMEAGNLIRRSSVGREDVFSLTKEGKDALDRRADTFPDLPLTSR